MPKPSTAAAREDFISGLSTGKKHALSLLVLFILPLIMYGPIFFGGKQYMGNDVIQWRAGAESVIEHIEENDGKHPNWATNMFAGMPAYVIHEPPPVPSIDTIISSISGSTQPLLNFWVLLGGLYCFFILLGVRPLASVVGAVLIGFTTYIPIIIEAGHYNKFIAYAYVPWMLTGYLLITRSDKKLLAFFVFSLAIMLQLRANHPQVTYYFLYLLGFWWIYDTADAYKNDTLRPWLYRTLLAFGAGVLALACSLEAYWRLYEYAQFSTRGGSTLGASQGNGLDLGYAFSWSQGIGELLTLIIPGLYGGASGEAYWGPKTFTSGPHYFGTVGFLLALIGLFRYRDKIKYLFLGVGTLTLLFSLGQHFLLLNEFMFRYVPFFNKFRTPEMWLIVTVFCFSVLAVYGIEALFSLIRNKQDSFRQLYLPLGIAVGLGIVFALGSDALLSFEKPGEVEMIARQNNVSAENPQIRQQIEQLVDARLKPERKEMARSDSVRYLVLVLLAGSLIWAFYANKISKGYFLAGLILLTSYDLLSVGARYVHESRMVSDDLTAEQLIQRQLRPMDQFILQNIGSGEGYPYRVFPLLDNPFNNAIPSYFYPTIGGYTGAKLAIYQDLIDHLLITAQGINEPVLDMLNVKYITTGQPLPMDGYTQVYAQNNNLVYRNEDVLPKAFFVDSVTTVSSPRAAVELMQPEANFSPADHAIVETSDPVSIEPDTMAHVRVTEYDANSITLETQSNKDGFLVLSEIYYPAGWEATLDGEPTEIYKTDFVLRGFKVPAGAHTIRLEFEPASSYWGKRIAWAGHILLWLCGIGGVVLAYRDKQS